MAVVSARFGLPSEPVVACVGGPLDGSTYSGPLLYGWHPHVDVVSILREDVFEREIYRRSWAEGRVVYYVHQSLVK